MKQKSIIPYFIDSNGFYNVFLSDEQKYIKLSPELLFFIGYTETEQSFSPAVSFLSIELNKEAKEKQLSSLLKKVITYFFIIKEDRDNLFSFYCKDLRLFLNDFYYTLNKNTRRCPNFLFTNESIYQALCFLKGFILGSNYKVLNSGKIIVYVDTLDLSNSLINLFHFCGIETEIKNNRFDAIYITWKQTHYDSSSKTYQTSDPISNTVKKWFFDYNDFKDISNYLTKQTQAVLDEKEQLKVKNFVIGNKNTYQKDQIKGFEPQLINYLFDGIPKYITLKSENYSGFQYRIDVPFYDGQDEVILIDYDFSNVTPITRLVYTNHSFYFCNSNLKKYPLQPNFRLIKKDNIIYIVPDSYWVVNAGNYIIKWKIEKYSNVGELLSRKAFASNFYIHKTDGKSESEKATIEASDFTHVEDNTYFHGVDNVYKTATGFYLATDVPSDDLVFFRDFPELRTSIDICFIDSFIDSVVYSDKGGGCTEGTYKSIIDHVSIKNRNYELFKTVFNEIGNNTEIQEDITDCYNIDFVDGIIEILSKPEEKDSIYSYTNAKKENKTESIPLEKNQITTQQIFYPGEIGATGKINGIGIYITDDFDAVINRNLTISIENTDLDNLESYVSSPVKKFYFNGDIELAKGINWIHFNYNDSFEYTGKNIIVQISDNTENIKEEDNLYFYSTEQDKCCIKINKSNNIKELLNIKNSILFSFEEEDNKEKELFIGNKYPFININDSFNYNSYFPFSVNSNTTFSQFIYRPEEIVFDGNIESLEFYYTGLEDYNYIRNLLVFVSVVNENIFNSYEKPNDFYNIENLNNNNFTADNYILKNGWNKITLKSPVNYIKTNTDDNSKNNLIISFFVNSYKLNNSVIDYDITLNLKTHKFLCFNTEKLDAFSEYKEGDLMNFSSVSSNDFFNYRQKPVLHLNIKTS